MTRTRDRLLSCVPAGLGLRYAASGQATPGVLRIERQEGPCDRFEDDAMNMVSEARTMVLRLGSLLGRACGASHGIGGKDAGRDDFRLTSADEAPAIIAGSPDRRIAGSPDRRIAYLCVFMAPPKPIILSA